VLKYNVIGDEHVYVAGDSRPMPFSKSANTSNTEGKFVAKLIAAHAAGKRMDWVSPTTTCYSMVNASPNEAISVDARYAYDAAKREFSFSKDTKMFEDRNTGQGKAALDWAQGLYSDLFG
jgi:NADH dehydrogenase FAD-containing subunit